MTTRFDARFETVEAAVDIGPFNSREEAEKFGVTRENEQVRFAGVAARGRVEAFDATIALLKRVQSSSLDAGRRHGVVNRLLAGEKFGFIHDETGRSWFFSRTDLSSEVESAIRAGDTVSFTGSIHPHPNKDYPQAFSVKITEAP
ncbi:hypothetical protein JOD54_002167 [Actinokineospora baliensis]|uniref:hypothetical protein n=1 Tax=Actinokineospora baliensis TaxID=547056 RepID=UPI0019599276|nr:hypothetical protein [Actinokineospora baliensis]MBM7771963.1 hypothetical protein [Actinokineospora baliensis]